MLVPFFGPKRSLSGNAIDKSLHFPCNTETHVVVELTSVFDSDYVPTENNPFDEALQEGQYVSWEKNSLLEDELDTPHAKVRKIARDNYLATF